MVGIDTPCGGEGAEFQPAAASTTVIFAQAGTYGLTATVADGGKTVSGTLSASVVQTVTSVVVGPVSSPVSGTSLALSAQGLDQFGKAMTTAPLHLVGQHAFARSDEPGFQRQRQRRGRKHDGHL